MTQAVDIEKRLIESNLKNIETSTLAKEEYRINISKSTENTKEIIKLLKELEQFFEETQVEKLKIKDKIPVITSKIEDIDLQLDKLEKEIHKNQISLAKIESEEEVLLKKLNEEYNLTFAEGLSFKLEGYDIAILKNEVAELKKRITALGVVNLGAIEEFKEVNEKYTFKELFKGGSADLSLQGDDELTCKIEIDVEPPGKKLQNINLLSGGEKVLSAIALLFAILKMKPTPFCILDEIEAALDDANVLRYGEFLKKFSENIQFIVITHRKGTMETSDMIYGVTMEEKGVSKVVSMEFNKE